MNYYHQHQYDGGKIDLIVTFNAEFRGCFGFFFRLFRWSFRKSNSFNVAQP